MDESDGESVIRTRTRRANAGNRLAALIQTEQPLDDAENIFLELDDDEEFDVEKNNLIGDNLLSSSDEKDENEDGDNEEDNAAFDSDMNASTTDDSDIENDDEPEDAGEQELVKQQRAAAREKRKADQKKMFKIKVRHPKPPSQERKPRRALPPAEVVLESSRRRNHSSRETARKSKEHLLEQIRENEKRKAQYVAPRAVAKPKLTQEQRLEEAKITEAKNLASLNHFVELEEIRKQEHRLAMLKRRPKLSEFVRYTSATVFVYPMADSDDELDVKPELPQSGETVKVEVDANQSSSQPETRDVVLSTSKETDETPKATEPTQTSEEPTKEPSESAPVESSEPSEPIEETVEPTEEPEERTEEPRDVSETTEEPKDHKESEEPKDHKESEEPKDLKESEEPKDLEESTEGKESTKENEETKESTEPKVQAVKDESNDGRDDEPKDEDYKARTKKKTKNTRQVQNQDDDDVDDRISGPPAINNVDFVTIHEFPEHSYNKYAVRSIVLGKKASKIITPPAKRVCPFTGRIAKYLDPSSQVAYASFDANKLLKMTKEDKLAWSHELGGVYLAPFNTKVRHASGVPEGFA